MADALVITHAETDPRWPVLQRLLSCMPGVRRTGSDRVGWGKEGVPPWIPEGLYPQRVMAAPAWAVPVERIPAHLVTQRPVDWVICDDELHLKTGDLGVETALATLMSQLHRRGGYLILQVPTSGDPGVDMLQMQQRDICWGPFEWWAARVESVADTLGYTTTWLWQAMFRFALLRSRVATAEEMYALQNWTLDGVLLVEMRPMRKEHRIEPAEIAQSRWERIWRRFGR